MTIDSPVPPSSVPPKRWTMPLDTWYAWQRQDAEAWERFLGLGVDVNAEDPDGWTPLRWALHGRNGAVMTRLIDAGADLRTVTHQEGSLLEQAFTERNEDAALHLLTAGAPLLTTEGQTPRTWLLEAMRRPRLDLIRILLDHPGVDATAQDARGQTALHLLVQGSPGADAGVRATVAGWLVQHGTPIDKQDQEGRTALLLAIRCGQATADVRDALIDAGANPDLPDLNGWGWDRMASGSFIEPAQRVALEQRFLRQALGQLTPARPQEPGVSRRRL